jgi:hypothetical protein
VPSDFAPFNFRRALVYKRHFSDFAPFFSLFTALPPLFSLKPQFA